MYNQQIYERLRERQETNHMFLTGELETPFTKAFTSKHGLDHYEAFVSAKRNGSSTKDTIRVLAAAYQLEQAGITPDDGSVARKRIALSGSIRISSYYDEGHKKWHQRATLHATDIFELTDDPVDKNTGTLCGYIEKLREPRVTKVGKRIITDFTCRVPRTQARNQDCIPCIAWEECSKILPSLGEGAYVTLEGHLQERRFTKTLKDGAKQEHIVHEFSVSKAVKTDVPE